MNLLKQFTGVKKPIYSLDCQFIIKNIKGYRSTARWRDTQGEAMNKEAWIWGPSSWSVAPYLFTNLETLPILTHWDFMKALSHRPY